MCQSLLQFHGFIQVLKCEYHQPNIFRIRKRSKRFQGSFELQILPPLHPYLPQLLIYIWKMWGCNVMFANARLSKKDFLSTYACPDFEKKCTLFIVDFLRELRYVCVPYI